MVDTAEQALKQVLVIDDEENMRHMLSVLLNGEGYFVETVESGVIGLNVLKNRAFDFVLCDIRMPEMDGLAFLEEISRIGYSPTIIMMSAYGTVDTAIEAMKRGAYDFISKPFKTDEVILVLRKAEERERLRQENIRLKKKIAGLEQTVGLDNMIGRSRAMQEVFRLAEKVARHTTTVLITGESGTGKELVARGIYKKGDRASKPFVAVNCGSIPDSLLESEFFGYVRGAFTGADRDKKGLFEEADGGSLFLDEIGELPSNMQVKLLRVLQEQEVRRVGSAIGKKIDVRVMAATAKDLAVEVKAGHFREDLFYRLNVINIHIPPLKERTSDIPLLCDTFISKFTAGKGLDMQTVSPAAMRILLNHAWPGNVRELENVIERAVVLAESGIVQPEDLPESLFGHQSTNRLHDLLGTGSIKKGRQMMEQRLIAEALETTGGNKSRAAQLLEISYPSLLNKIKEYGLSVHHVADVMKDR